MPDRNDRSDDRALLLAATDAAAALAHGYFNGGDVARWDKSPGNPVSAADLAVDAQLKDVLLRDRPDYGWLSEETADDPARLDCRRVWVVDPIDGTRDFLRGRTGWAVSVALVEDGVVVLAALAAPARGQVFVAEAGAGAMLNGASLSVSIANSLAGIRLPVDAGTLAGRFWPEAWDAVAIEVPNSLALRMAHVATGTADGFFHGRTAAEWDIAAATLIIAEAGGTVSDRDGTALAFNKPNPAVPGIVAATPLLHAALQARLAAGLAAYAASRSRR